MAKSLDKMLENVAPEIISGARKKADEILLNMHLAEVRTRASVTQGEIAKALGVSQPTISEMEQPGKNITVNSLKRYVEASGSKLRLDVELPDGTHYGFSL